MLTFSACQTQPTQPASTGLQKQASGFKIQTTASDSVKTAVFPAQIFERKTGKPTIEQRTFLLDAADLNQRFIFTLINGPSGKARVSSATVKLNGKELLSPKDFNQQVGTLSLPLEHLQAGQNTLEIKLASQPGSAISVGIDLFKLPENTPGAVHSLIEDTPAVRQSMEYVPGRIGIKFLEGMQVRLQTQTNGQKQLVDLSGISLISLESWMKQRNISTIHRAVGLSPEQLDQDEAKGEALLGTDTPNLNLFYYLETSPQADIWALVDQLRQLPFVEEAFPEFVPQQPAALPLPTDPEVSNAGHTEWLKVAHIMPNDASTPGSDDPGAWSITQGKPEIKIAALGYGIQHTGMGLGITQTHEDLGNIQVFSNFDATTVTTLPYLNLSHGTATIGIMGANGNNGKGLAGIAHQGTTQYYHAYAQGYRSKCSGTGQPNCDPGADSIYQARNQGVRVIVPEVWGGGCKGKSGEHYYPGLRAAIPAMISDGMAVLIPAGNHANQNITEIERNGKIYKMPDTGSIYVGGLDKTGQNRAKLTCESFTDNPYNYGISHPFGNNNLYTNPNTGHGTDVSSIADLVIFSPEFDSKNPHLNNLYINFFNGTSAATPTVAGIVGLMLAVKPDLSPLEIRKTLRETRGVNSEGEIITATDGTQIAGMVNAYKALTRYTSGPPGTNKPGLFGKFYANTYHLAPEVHLNNLATDYPNAAPLPDFTQLEPHEPFQTKVVPNIDFQYPSGDPFNIGLKSYYVADFQGIITVPAGKQGNHEFSLGHHLGDLDGAILEIDGERVVNANLPGFTTSTGNIDLTAGEHQIRVMMYQINGPTDLFLTWKQPGSTNHTVIPTSALSHTQAQEITPVPLNKPGLVGRFYHSIGNPPSTPYDGASNLTRYVGSKLFAKMDLTEASVGPLRVGDVFGIGEKDNISGVFSAMLKLPPGYAPGLYRFQVVHDDGVSLMWKAMNSFIVRAPTTHSHIRQMNICWEKNL